MTSTKITVGHIDDLAESTVSEPTLVRWASGDIDVVTGSTVSGTSVTVLATQEDYLAYCDGDDDDEQRTNFAADLAAHE